MARRGETSRRTLVLAVTVSFVQNCDPPIAWPGQAGTQLWMLPAFVACTCTTAVLGEAELVRSTHDRAFLSRS